MLVVKLIGTMVRYRMWIDCTRVQYQVIIFV
jgi:hypothetical protein